MSFLAKMFLKKSANDRLRIDGVLQRHPSATIRDSRITVAQNAKLFLAENSRIIGYSINILKGECSIGPNTTLERGCNDLNPVLSIEDGYLSIGDHCIIRSDFSIRFGGKCTIGSYTGVMERTELRSDELLTIGDFNMISYECMIYDTNTHAVYDAETRRGMTRRDFPLIGLEFEKPATRPTHIGNDCWVGKRAAIFKGVTIGDGATVGACAVITKDVPRNNIAYGNPSINKAKHNR